jgi:hypothetical protein
MLFLEETRLFTGGGQGISLATSTITLLGCRIWLRQALPATNEDFLAFKAACGRVTFTQRERRSAAAL